MDSSKFFTVRPVWSQICAVLVLLTYCATVNAELILTSPPRESATDGEKQYGPLATYLTEALGEKVTYRQPKSWLHYQRDMRNDVYDIIFDGPHFISWRMHELKHVPVAKLPGTLAFMVITSKENAETNALDDLTNTPVCAIAPPNLATLTVLAAYKNPVRQPRLVTAKGGMPGVYKAFKDGKCGAVILRDKYYMKKVSEDDRAGQKIIYQSVPVTNQGISVSSRISAIQSVKIAAALTEVNKATEMTLKRFAPKAEKMIAANGDDYEDHYKLLTGVIFGWEITNEDFVKANSGK